MQTNGAPGQPGSDPFHSRIFAALSGDLRRTARRLTRNSEDADDLVQDTLLRVWSRMAMAATGSVDAKPVHDLRAYAFATLRHRAYARAALVQPVEAEAEDAVAPRGSDATTRMACAEALEALAALPEEQQSLLKMRAIDGLSYAEIARTTGLPLGTVTSRLARGRGGQRGAVGISRKEKGKEEEGGGGTEGGQG